MRIELKAKRFNELRSKRVVFITLTIHCRVIVTFDMVLFAVEEHLLFYYFCTVVAHRDGFRLTCVLVFQVTYNRAQSHTHIHFI